MPEIAEHRIAVRDGVVHCLSARSGSKGGRAPSPRAEVQLRYLAGAAHPGTPDILAKAGCRAQHRLACS